MAPELLKKRPTPSFTSHLPELRDPDRLCLKHNMSRSGVEKQRCAAERQKLAAALDQRGGAARTEFEQNPTCIATFIRCNALHIYVYNDMYIFLRAKDSKSTSKRFKNGWRRPVPVAFRTLEELPAERSKLDCFAVSDWE